jgi:hypothetical protein
MAPSRNDPCPCGSGKKYKKCCLARDEEAQRRTAENEHEASDGGDRADGELILDDDDVLARALEAPFDEDPFPWPLARAMDRDPDFADERARDPAWAACAALPSEVEKLSTDEIRARLRALGVGVTEEQFRELARGRTVAWSIARAWRADLSRELSRGERDFLGIAACELWRRLVPDRPSQEMLDDAIEAGYAARDAKRWDEALETWLGAWDVVWSRLPGDARALDGSRPAFEDTAYLREWIDDLLDELWLAGHDDPAPALRGLRLLDDLLARFPDEPEVARTVWRANRASFLVAVGREEEGKRILREIINEHPDRSVGWLSLADALVLVGERDPAPLAEAADLLATARARVADAKEWRLEERYREILKLLRRAQSGA